MANFAKSGKNISSKAEILNVSPFGIWLHYQGKEYYLDYQKFPWFAEARIKEIFNFEVKSGSHFYWPVLDIDLTIEQIEHPERWPLVARRLKR